MGSSGDPPEALGLRTLLRHPWMQGVNTGGPTLKLRLPLSEGTGGGGQSILDNGVHRTGKPATRRLVPGNFCGGPSLRFGFGTHAVQLKPLLCLREQSTQMPLEVLGTPHLC